MGFQSKSQQNFWNLKKNYKITMEEYPNIPEQSEREKHDVGRD